jgi:catechol 2,3-dioxygenase-like lactoylglutathione lyase family enzyme
MPPTNPSRGVRFEDSPLTRTNAFLPCEERLRVMSRFMCCIPILTVRDLSQSRDFFVGKLGFDLDFEWGSPVSYIGLRRDDVVIHAITAPTSWQEPGTANISIMISEVDAYHAHCRKQGVEILVEPDDRSYRLRDFSVKDPDGNIINFGSEIL